MVKTLHLEFEGGYYPYSYINENGNVEGALVELWKIIAQVANVRLTVARSGGRLVTAQNIFMNQTFTLLDTSALNAERHSMFLISAPFGYYEANFYESARDVDQETTELFFFTVFRWNAVILLAASYFICSICCILLGRNSTNHRASGIHHVIEKFAAGLFLISLTLLVFHHNAGFQGNNFIVQKAKETTFQELEKGIRGGTRTAIEQVPDQFPPEEVAILTAKNKDAIVFEPDNRKILERLCTNRRESALLYSNQILEIGQIDHPCELAVVKSNSEVNRQLSQYNHTAYSLGISVPGYFLYSKQANRKMIRLVDQVVLKLFQQEMFENFWTKRHLTSLRKLQTSSIPSNVENVVELSYKPMSFPRLSIIFYLFAGALLVSIGSFIGEIIFPLFFPKEKVYGLPLIKHL